MPLKPVAGKLIFRVSLKGMIPAIELPDYTLIVSIANFPMVPLDTAKPV